MKIGPQAFNGTLCSAHYVFGQTVDGGPFNIWYKLVYFWFELTVLVLVLSAVVLVSVLVLPVPFLVLVLVLPLLVLTTSLVKSV